MTGSHLDSVRNGGKFDGPAGVLGAVEAVRALNELEIRTKHPLELVITCSEEPNAFGISTFGSRGMVAKLAREDLQQLKDEDGRSFKEALAFVGGNLDEIDRAVRKPGDIAAFVEIHIEQMPNLYEKDIDIGIVDGITGICRKNIKIRGEAGHCGTTPMDKRKDALCAASEIVLALERAAKEQNGKALATVGHVRVFPNAINITPSVVDMIAEIRSFYPEYSKALVDHFNVAIEKTIKQRGVGIQTEVNYDTKPIYFSDHVKDALRKSCQFFGLTHMDLYSMAGHDAAHMAEVSKAGMIFIPCRDGISHRPDEWTEPSNIIKGAQVLLGALLLLDSGQL
jgi:N-carbamoyl-L-amino-acid hydrolase